MNIVINTYERTTLWPSVNSHRAEIGQITKKIPFKFEKEKWVEIINLYIEAIGRCFLGCYC